MTTDTNVTRDENVVFGEWMAAAEGSITKAMLEGELLSLLEQHAMAVCYQKLGERRPDIVNQAMFKAIAKAGTFRGDCKFSTWFQHIVQNLCKNALREKVTRRRRERSLDYYSGRKFHGDGYGKLLCADECTPGFKWSDLAQLRFNVTPEQELQAKQLLEGLTATDRRLVQMKLDGWSEDEMAQALGIASESARHRWWRLRKRLKKSLRRKHGTA